MAAEEAIARIAEPAPPLLRQAAPMVLSRAGLAGMVVVDAIMVAQVGAGELAVSTLAEGTFGRLADVFMVFMHAALVLVAASKAPALTARRIAVWHRSLVAALLMGAVGLGIASVAGSLLLAAGQEATLAGRAATVILILAVGLPAGLAALASAVHLEATGRAGLVARWMLAANIANAGLNYLLIGGHLGFPAWGATGSAVATTLVRAGLAVALLAAVRSAEGRVAFRRAEPHGGDRRDHLRIGSAASGTAACMHGIGIWLTVFAGWLGTAPLAAYASGWILNLPGLLLAAGLSDAIAVRVAAAGRGNGAETEAAHLLRADLSLLAAVLLPIAAFLALAAGPVAAFYTPDPALAALMASLLPLSGIALFLDGMSYGLTAALRGRRDVTVPTAIQIAAMAATPPLAAWLAFVHETGARGLVVAIVATSSVRLALLAWRAATVFGARRTNAPQPRSEAA